MHAIHKNGEYVFSQMDAYIFHDKVLEGEKLNWCSRIQLENNKLKIIITIGDYILLSWIPGEEGVMFENRNDKEHGYSEIYAEWIMIAIGYDVVKNLLQLKIDPIKPFVG
jgi:hypothetical protein